MKTVLIAVASFCALALAIALSFNTIVSADDRTYGCFLEKREVFWDGHAHPAAFDIAVGPVDTGFGVLLGSDCDGYPSRADFRELRQCSHRQGEPCVSVATRTPVPTATATPVPPPVPPPVPTPTVLPTETPVPPATPTPVPVKNAVCS